MNEQLETAEPRSVEVLQPGRSTLDPQALIQQAISNGAGVDTLERLFALAVEVRATQARELWYRAMAEFQRTCPPIKKTREGQYGMYAPLDEILSTIQPVMGPLGLSLSWRTRIENNTVIANARVSHEAGHLEESGELAMPIPPAGQRNQAGEEKGANAMQRVGIARTYACRYSVLTIIGKTGEDDTDGDSGSRQRPIARPKTKSGGESQGTPQREERAQDEPTGEIQTWRGQITGIKKKDGETGGRKWTRFTVTTDEQGVTFSTLDKELAELAYNLLQQPVFVEWEQTRYGRELRGVAPDNSGE